MRYEMVLSLDGLEQTLQITSETFKKWLVWKVKFKEGKEVVLFKCGNIWMQRNEDSLDHHTLTAIGKQIDHRNLNTAFV
jgi:hypothetical protein